MATSINTLKNWFRTGLKPTQAQFWAWLDSYRHKDEAVPVKDVSGLQELLDTKVDKKELVQPDQVGPYDPLKSYVFDAAVAEYVSFSNPQSTNPQYQVEGFYRLKENAPAGESPETHPAHWVYQGTVLGDIAIEDVVGLREELDWLSENAGGVTVDQLIVKGSANAVSGGAVYKYFKETFKVESTTDTGIIALDEAFKVTSITAPAGLTVTIKKSDGTAYILGDNVAAFDFLTVKGNVLNKVFTIRGEIL